MSVYLEAAQMVDTGIASHAYSCCEIDRAARTLGVIKSDERLAYTDLFRPPDCSLWMTESFPWGDDWGTNDDDRRTCRVLALLFMHWMTRP